jgi:hypothetical protein
METTSNAGASLNDVLQAAIDAEKKGVPVNWRDMCMTVYTVATNHIANMEKKDNDQGE